VFRIFCIDFRIDRARDQQESAANGITKHDVGKTSKKAIHKV
jgi:hypothetical protein